MTSLSPPVNTIYSLCLYHGLKFKYGDDLQSVTFVLSSEFFGYFPLIFMSISFGGSLLGWWWTLELKHCRTVNYRFVGSPINHTFNLYTNTNEKKIAYIIHYTSIVAKTTTYFCVGSEEPLSFLRLNFRAFYRVFSPPILFALTWLSKVSLKKFAWG